MRRHFDKPYVKPLIISVGLMFTVGVFRYKDYLRTVFEGWGIIGTILLVLMAATIPYGLCRGFGVSGGRAFFLSYILIYILSWVKFPQFYHTLADKNLGLINFGLLILFIVGILKVVKFAKLPSFGSKSMAARSPFRPQIDREIEVENQEKGLITQGAEKMTRLEVRSMEDIATAINDILRLIETYRNNLPKEEREKIAKLLNRISKDEDIFKRNIRRLQRLFQRLRAIDAQHFRELKERLGKASVKEKKLIKAEIEGEEEKMEMERAVFEFERKLTQALNSFNQWLQTAIDHIRDSPYPYDAVHPLTEARKTLENIATMIKETAQLEEKLVGLVKSEKKFLEKEGKST